MTHRDVVQAALIACVAAVIAGVACALIAGYGYDAPAWAAKSTGLIIGWVVYTRLAFRGPS
jgi:hypothetical protein